MDEKSYTLHVPKRVARIALIVVLTALVVAPLTAVATHSFTDVPESNTFHNDIAWLEQSGVTRGCNPPANTEFCPDDPVSREQMSAFMRRLAQYMGAEDGTPAEADHAATADNAQQLQGQDSSDFLRSGEIVTTIGGGAWLPAVDSPTTVDHGSARTQVSGDGTAVVPLSASTQFGSTSYGLESFELCYVVSGGGFVTSVQVARTNDGSPDVFVLMVDQTDRTTSGCTTYSIGHPIGSGAGILVQLDGGGTVDLGGVKATWSQEASGT